MGKGKDQTANVVAGGCCAVCCGVCFLVLGLPMLIAGIVLVKIYQGDYDAEINDAISQDPEYNNLGDDDLDEAKGILYKVGIGLIVVAVICVVIGIIMVVVLCTGCCGRNRQTNAPSHVVVTQQYPVGQAGVQQQGGYYQPGQPPQGGYYANQPGQQQAPPPGYEYQMKA